MNPFFVGGVLPREDHVGMQSRAIRLEGAGLRATSAVERAQEREREFEARLAECSGLAFRVAFAVLRQRQDAEDVAQEAFVRAHQRFHQLRDRDRFRAWLVRMTWRLAIDRQRQDRRRMAREGVDPVSHASLNFADVVMERDRAAQLWRAIDALPHKLRVVIVLANIQEHDLAATARLLNLPEGTVKSRLFLARRKLKEILSCRNELTDIDREIQEALAVEPSPDFVARVRTRVASEPQAAPWRAGWILAASLAVAAVLTLAIPRLQLQTPSGPVTFGSRRPWHAMSNSDGCSAGGGSFFGIRSRTPSRSCSA